MTWHRHRRRPRPPRFVRRMGCAFAGLIVVSAITASSVVSLLTRTPQRWMIVVPIALAVTWVMSATFMRTIRRATSIFREQDVLRRQLMADVAHELRTPLAILQGRIEGLLDGVYPRDDERMAELLAETQHLSRLVEDVRTLANAEAGALDLRKERVDPAELIRDAASSFERVRLDMPEDLPHIEADPTRIREVLLNLLANAEQHAPGGTITIRAEARARELVIQVRDDGPGIPAEELPHLFERFRKGRSSRGSGLGLSIARKLVLAHDGEIGVESAEGAGTTVTVLLPR
jgi:two-component system sensor histidine kinase BaeS